MATFMFLGMALTIKSLTPNMVRTTKIRPDIRVMAMMAPKDRVLDWSRAPNMKFVPIPVASAKGRLA